MTWWEKTVEYQFVAEGAREGLFAAPLAGREETAGDAIAVRGTRLLLIEFKRDEPAIASEQDKFSNYEAARQELARRDRHHVIVFGDVLGTPPRLILRYRTYFSEIEIERDELFCRGKDETSFKAYLTILLRSKKPRTDGGSISSPEAYGLVAGVQVDSSSGRTEIVSVRSLAEYLGVSLRLERERRQRSHGSLGIG